MRQVVALTAVSALLLAAAALADTYRVSDLRTLADLLGERADPGDVIEIEYGIYYLDVPRINILRSGTPEKPIIIRGVMKDGKRSVIDAKNVNVRRAVFSFEPGTHDVVMEDLEIRNAAGGVHQGRSYGYNATACYLQGKNLTLRNIHSHHNEDGFFATHNSDYILVENCEIDHSGTRFTGRHNRTHNFYFCARHQIVRNCYIHHSIEAQNWKSRGGNTIFAYNWVEEDAGYSVEVASDNEQNTLWLGNVVIKRTSKGMSQGRLLGLGDGTGVAGGTLVALNNTFVTVFPRDLFLFTVRSSTGDVVLINNVFTGPGRVFLSHHGHGSVMGRNNWIQEGAANVPHTLGNTILGAAPGFVDLDGFDFRLKPGSPLVDAGVSKEEYLRAVRLVTDHARGGAEARPSPIFLRALEEIERPAPAFQPVRGAPGFSPREVQGAIDIGGFEFTTSGN